jgi:hypothetical protein
MGMRFSQAEARYENEEGKNVRLKIMDMGSMGAAAAMASAAWAMQEFERETESGYERSTKLGEHRGMEEYDRESRNGTFKIIVAGRFEVELNGNEVDDGELRRAAGELDLGKLAGMKNAGVSN